MYFDNSVLFESFLWVNVDLCWVYLCLKVSFSQSDVVLGCSLIRCRRGYLGVVYEAGG